MCFSKPPEVKVPDAPPVPSAEAEDARRRRANEAETAKQSQGRAATIITSPLGDSSFGENIRRTQITGF